MRILRAFLAALLAAGPVQAQPVVELLTRYSVSIDATAASVQDSDAPPGSGKNLAELESNLALVTEGLEAFAHPHDAAKALRAARPRLPAGVEKFFRDRAGALDSLYRTLAVVDYTWALRFPEPPCSPAERRSTLLRSADGLFTDPSSGKTSEWMSSLLGPHSREQSLETALDQASTSASPNQGEYARLRARQNMITKALESESAVGEARAMLYCKRAETRIKLALANRVSGPVLAAQSSLEKFSRQGLVIIVGVTPAGLEARGAGVVVETASGARVLTDRRLGTGEVAALLDGRYAPVPLRIEREDEKSGLMLFRSEGDLGKALTLAESGPQKDDLVFVSAHSERLGAWTRTQGLVTDASPDQFQTDAVTDVSMVGGVVIDEGGLMTGLLVFRPVEGGAGEWPAAVSASALRVWLADGRAPAAAPVSLSDAGTTRILTASRPLLESMATGTGAVAASAGAIYTQTPWGTVRGVCMANCEDARPSPSYSGAYNGNGELGDALGKLAVIGMEALIFKGIPALFRGIGSLFKSKPRAAAPQIAPKSQPSVVRFEKPPEPVRIECELKPVGVPASMRAEEVTVKVRLECPGHPEVELGDREVSFTLGWDKEVAEHKAIEAVTDPDGYASFTFYLNNTLAKAERNFDDLDRHDPDRSRPPEIERIASADDSSIQNASREDGPINAADPKPARVEAKPEEKSAKAPVPAGSKALALNGMGQFITSAARFTGKRGVGLVAGRAPTALAGGALGGPAGLIVAGATIIITIRWELASLISAQDKRNAEIVTHKKTPLNSHQEKAFDELAEENNRKCLPATSANIKSVVSNSEMKTMQPSVSAPGVQTYVDMIENGLMPPPIKVDGEVIVDGNHRYIAGLLCQVEVGRTRATAPFSAPRYPIRQIKVDELDWRQQ